MKGRQFIKKLRDVGVTVVPSRGKGGHVGLAFHGRKTTLPFHGDRDISPTFLKDVCKQLGLDPREIL